MASLNQLIRPILTLEAAPDALPTAVVYRNGVVVVGAAVTVTDLGDLEYRFDYNFLSAVWALGDSYKIKAKWKYGGVDYGQPVAQGLIRGDAFSRLGENGAGLTALGDARLAAIGGAVASVTAPVNVADKTGFSLATAPPTAAEIRAEIDSNSTQLADIKAKTDNLDVTLSSRLADEDYTAPDNAGIAEIKAKTDNLPGSPASQSDVIGVGTAILTAINEIPEEVTSRLRGAGDYLFDPRIENADGIAISGAPVTLRRVTEGGVPEPTVFLRGLTNSIGHISFGDVAGFALEAGRYLAIVPPIEGYFPLAPQDFTIEGDYLPLWVMERFVITGTENDVGLVPIEFNAANFGQKRAGCEVTLRVRTKQQTHVFGDAFDALLPETKITGADGKVVFWRPPSEALPRENERLLEFHLTCPDPFVNKTFVNPIGGINVKDA